MRVGVIGTGFGTKVHLPGYALVPEVDVVAVCSSSADRARAAADKFGVPDATDDFRELVARDDVDLVDVCTPPALHEEMTLAALDAGKHVLCEKPAALRAPDVRAMAERAEAAGVIHAINHEMRYTPAYRHLRELVATGFLGDLRLVHTSVHQGYVTNPSAEPYWWTWVAERAQGGGMLMSLLSHHLDLLRATFGPLQDVQGRWSMTVPERPMLPWPYRDGDPLGPDIEPVGFRAADVDDTAVIIGHIGPAALSISAGWAVHHGTGIRIEAYGSEGSLLLDNAGQLHAGRPGEELAPLDVPDHLQVRDPDVGDRMQGGGASLIPMFAEMVRDIVAATSKPQQPQAFATFWDGLATAEVIDAVLETPGIPQ